ncbi:hypothetical protein EYF80_065906 [Liparis tanakae]|uniref:Uncharacterized protein n=1 Tax=Liparis tanakae TaxID=230148 RepID=A0A4Z2E5C1_9TELE|nr:hypothetical protein EYF80_065906 [Liparis tanakae]
MTTIRRPSSCQRVPERDTSPPPRYSSQLTEDADGGVIGSERYFGYSYSSSAGERPLGNSSEHSTASRVYFNKKSKS